MSIFGTILSKIFPSSHPATQAATTPAAASGAAPTAASPAGATPSPAATGQATQAAAAPPVDVAAVLGAAAAKRPEKLNWQSSIVDLLKLLDMDSSLDARKSLAKELNFSGDTNDSASMNIWLQKQVMQKLAQNGGIVPDALKH